MIAFPNAKINLGLNILRKRADGYHDIESCFYPIPWHDVLEVVPASTLSFSSEGLSIPGSTDDNLCLKAYHLLHEAFDIPPVEIVLLKNIPMGAGLGGGSADGALTLTLLNDLFQLQLTADKLQAYALQLGSDCPFFIKNQAAIASGRGDVLNSCTLDLTGKYLAIKNPGIHISTAQAYAGVAVGVPVTSIKEIIQQPIGEWKDVLKNDFEEAIFPLHPAIKQLKEDLYEAGALYASMTGSGSTVFGLFEHKVDLHGWTVLTL